MVLEKQVNSNRLKSLFWGVIILLVLAIGLVIKNVFSVTNVNSENGRVNFLILGKSGAGHAGADLTDTLIFASLSLKTPTLTLISIPRDLWIPEIRAKVNSAYYWGGIPLAKSLTEKITGQTVHYAAVIDFSGFKDIVEAVGGIEVEVERNFTDTKYPIKGREDDLCGGDGEYKCRFETIRFDQGRQKMNGELALKFVRSRNGDNGENTDLAREARQQKVIAAIKNEILSPLNLLNPFTDIKIYGALKNSIETDINGKAGIVLVQKLLLARNSVKSYVFPDGLLISPPVSVRYDNQYVFVPEADDWNELQVWIKGVLPP